MNIGDVVDELAVILDGIVGLNVFVGWPNRINPPAAIVQPPEITFDTTMARGLDTAVFPVTILVGNNDPRSAMKNISNFASGSGPSSVKAVLDGATYTTVDSVRVQSAELAVMQVAGVEYLTATFQVETIGSGS